MGTARDNPYRVPSWQRFPPASSLFNDYFSLMSQGLSAKYRQYAWLPRGRSKLARLAARATSRRSHAVCSRMMFRVSLHVVQPKHLRSPTTLPITGRLTALLTGPFWLAARTGAPQKPGPITSEASPTHKDNSLAGGRDGGEKVYSLDTERC